MYIISESDKNGILLESDDKVVYGVKRPLFSRFLKKYGQKGFFSCSVRVIRGVIAAAMFPNVSPLRAWLVFRQARQLIRQFNIDTVICVYRPFESIITGIWLKKQQDNIRMIAYHLDALMTPNNTIPLIVSYKNHQAKKYLKQEIDLFDLLIFPKSVKSSIEQNIKICYANFPLLVLDGNEEKTDFEYDNHCINLAYIGSIDGKNRSIDYLILLIEQLQKVTDRRIQLHIWGSIGESVRNQVEQCEFAHWYGLIHNNKTFDLLKRADFVVNLSNRVTVNMVPSKIFQLFATGKPIINIVENAEDAALPFFYKNTFACNVYSFKDIQTQIDMLLKFIDEKRGKTQEKEIIEKLYYDSCPSYIVTFFQ